MAALNKKGMMNGSAVISESAPKAQIARFHAGNFEPAYMPGANDTLAYTIHNQPLRSAYAVPFVNGMFGPLYGQDDIPVSRGIPCLNVVGRPGAAAAAISPENSNWELIKGYRHNPF